MKYAISHTDGRVVLSEEGRTILVGKLWDPPDADPIANKLLDKLVAKANFYEEHFAKAHEGLEKPGEAVAP